MKHSTENNTGEMKANGTHCNVQKATREREKSTAEALNSRVEPRLETTEQLLYSHRTFTVWMDKCSRRSSSNSKGIKKKSKTSIEERAIARSSILTFFCSFSLPFLFCLSLARSLTLSFHFIILPSFHWYGLFLLPEFMAKSRFLFLLSVWARNNEIIWSTSSGCLVSSE